ncbi:MAG: leucine-rich repeat protein [[Clostridium] aminophilum]|uniref:leucine-rich repeat protein n=1 Tax=[Clostridium] aminophilum TaxID=1526 RepID=UPI0026F1AE93|nr:leucine-rich repeat protein [[Clostridium] aminophilum]MDD6196805.1 leucine-rich repeat protein [[Clostridium] aminophilum]
MQRTGMWKRMTGVMIAVALFAFGGKGLLPAYAAESSVMGINRYERGVKGGVSLKTGNTYRLGGYSWMVAEQGTGYAVLQSNGVTSGCWPGYVISRFGNGSEYRADIDGQDISGYDKKTRELYEAIRSAEKPASYGRGLYLVGISKLGVADLKHFNRKGSVTSGGYRAPLMNAAKSWTGTYYYNGYASNQMHETAVCMYPDGKIHSDSDTYQGMTGNVAPAFNLDTSKVTLNGSELSIVSFAESTGIRAVQPVTSLTAGQTKALGEVISGVTYIDGTNVGRSAGYRISANVGTISGTNWTIPSSGAPKTATLIITETGSGRNLSIKKTVDITPDVTGLNVIQGITTVEEGSSAPLSSLFSSVQYSNGANAEYTVSMKTPNGGSIKNNIYTAPTGINRRMPVTLTVMDNTYSYVSEKTISIVPRAAKEIRIQRKSVFPGSLTEGTTADLASLIEVMGYDSGDQCDGEVRFELTDADRGEVDGTVYTAPKDLVDPISVRIGVKACGSAGEVDYKGKTAAFDVRIALDPNGGSENAVGFDDRSWYSFRDPESKIEWMYKLDPEGNIIGLYTENTGIDGIVDSGNCLNVPAKINGRPVAAIGGGTENHPFVPESCSEWSRISFPLSLHAINDYAFAGNTADAKVTIPSSICAVGLKAFYRSNLAEVRFPDFSGTVGSYAFGRTTNLRTLTARGSGDGMILSTASFADTALEDVTLTGNVTVHKKAFRDSNQLKRLTLNGAVRLEPYAVSDAGTLESLHLSGPVSIGSYAFRNNVSLQKLILPAGTSLGEYAFEGCTGLRWLEADCDLTSHSFEHTGNITRIVLGEGCESVAYDWEGNQTSFQGSTAEFSDGNDSDGQRNEDREFIDPGRIIYAKSSGTRYHFRNGDPKGSCFGASGTVQVYIPWDDADTAQVEHSREEDISLSGMNLWKNDVWRELKNAGNRTSVRIKPVVSPDEVMKRQGMAAEEQGEKTQTGIAAHYSGIILTSKELDKTKLTVRKMVGEKEGEFYPEDGFYAVRTSDVQEMLNGGAEMTAERIASFEPVLATEDDLKAGQTTGTLSVTVIVFFDGDGQRTFYAVPVSVRVEKYSAESYAEYAYGSYDAITSALVELEERMKEIENSLKNAGADSVETLIRELEDVRKQYSKLVETLSAYVSRNTADQSGFFGTTVAEDGTKTEVVFLEGRAVKYEKTDGTDPEGGPVYQARYDADGDGEAENIWFTVKHDGIHLTDQAGDEVKDDGTTASEGERGKVYEATLGILKKELAAQIDEICDRMDACDAGLKAMKEHLREAGAEAETQEGEDDYEKIVRAIDALSSKLNDAQSKAEGYRDALNSVLRSLKEEDGKEDKDRPLAGTLEEIYEKIAGLRENIAAAEENAAGLKEKLDRSDNGAAELRNLLKQREEDISSLKQQVESLIRTAQEYTDYTRDTEVNRNSASYVFGYDTGFERGKRSVNTGEYYRSGYAEGYRDGNRNAGSGSSGSDSKASYRKGYSDGLEDGVRSVDADSVYHRGYESGFAEGAASVRAGTGKEAGCESAYESGFAAGRKAAAEEAEQKDAADGILTEKTQSGPERRENAAAEKSRDIDRNRKMSRENAGEIPELPMELLGVRRIGDSKLSGKIRERREAEPAKKAWESEDTEASEKDWESGDTEASEKDWKSGDTEPAEKAWENGNAEPAGKVEERSDTETEIETEEETAAAFLLLASGAASLIGCVLHLKKKRRVRLP